MAREKCAKCSYIKDRCICHLISRINNRTELIILMHPSEKKHALNTVRIMELFFYHITVLYGESFNDDEYLLKIINDEKNSPALIFKNENAVELEKTNSINFTHLIFLDGTWKKAKKIYFCSTILHQLKTYSLSPNFSSQYKIRKSNMINGLSTLEAATYTLSHLEPHLDTSKVTSAFNYLIDYQIEKIGEEKFKRHYQK